MDNTQTTQGEVLQETNSPKGVTDVRFRTVKVSNVSLSLSERDIFEFLTFSGEILYIEMQRETETTQVAYVTFSNTLGAHSAALLTGSTMAGLPISITLTKDYQLPPHASSFTSMNWDKSDVLKEEAKPSITDSAMKKTEDVVSTTLAKGFVLGKDALKKAKSLDEKHHLTLIASVTVASIDRKMGLSETISMGTTVVREVDEILQVSEMTKSALAAAEQKASSAGSVIMSNHYLSAGALLLSTALSAVSKAAMDVSVMTKEKVDKAEEEKRETLEKERAGIASEFVNA
ncbi:hypothetical protein ACS0TY_011480 [Phlomoides rotata]